MALVEIIASAVLAAALVLIIQTIFYDRARERRDRELHEREMSR